MTRVFTFFVTYLVGMICSALIYTLFWMPTLFPCNKLGSAKYLSFIRGSLCPDSEEMPLGSRLQAVQIISGATDDLTPDK